MVAIHFSGQRIITLFSFLAGLMVMHVLDNVHTGGRVEPSESLGRRLNPVGAAEVMANQGGVDSTSKGQEIAVGAAWNTEDAFGVYQNHLVYAGG